MTAHRRSAAEEGVFRALAHRIRRELLVGLRARPGQSLTELCDDHAIARQAITRHLKVLADAGLVVTRWVGREKLHYLNAVPLAEVQAGWFAEFSHPAAHALLDLRKQLEDPSAGAKNTA